MELMILRNGGDDFEMGRGDWYPFTDYTFWQKCDLNSIKVK